MEDERLGRWGLAAVIALSLALGVTALASGSDRDDLVVEASDFEGPGLSAGGMGVSEADEQDLVVGIETDTLNGTGQTLLTGNKRVLSHGHRYLSYVEGERRVDLPAGYVLTDIVMTRMASSEETFCRVWLSEIVDGAQNPLHILVVTHEEPLAELHFETGLGSNGGLGFFADSDCLVHVLWSGYRLG